MPQLGAYCQKETNLRSRESKGRKGTGKGCLPSWIPVLTRSPCRRPEDELSGRVNRDGFVGGSDRKNYNAALRTYPTIRFGEVEYFYNPNNSRGTSPAGSNLNSPLFRNFASRASLNESSTNAIVLDISLISSPIENDPISKEPTSDTMVLKGMPARSPTPKPPGDDVGITPRSKVLLLEQYRSTVRKEIEIRRNNVRQKGFDSAPSQISRTYRRRDNPSQVPRNGRLDKVRARSPRDSDGLR